MSSNVNAPAVKCQCPCRQMSKYRQMSMPVSSNAKVSSNVNVPSNESGPISRVHLYGHTWPGIGQLGLPNHESKST